MLNCVPISLVMVLVGTIVDLVLVVELEASDWTEWEQLLIVFETKCDYDGLMLIYQSCLLTIGPCWNDIEDSVKNTLYLIRRFEVQ